MTDYVSADFWTFAAGFVSGWLLPRIASYLGKTDADA